MKRSLGMAVLAVGTLLLAGCGSSGTGGTSTVASSTGSASAASSTENSTDTGTDSDAETGATVVPAELDAQTTTWFTTLCSGMAPAITLASGLDTSGQDAAAAQKAGADALNQLSTALATTGSALASIPPPTFDGGAAFASQMASGLTDSATQISAAATSFAAIDPADSTALSQATSDLTDQLDSATAPLQNIEDLDPSISAAAQELPACQGLGG